MQNPTTPHASSVFCDTQSVLALWAPAVCQRCYASYACTSTPSVTCMMYSNMYTAASCGANTDGGSGRCSGRGVAPAARRNAGRGSSACCAVGAALHVRGQHCARAAGNLKRSLGRLRRVFWGREGNVRERHTQRATRPVLSCEVMRAHMPPNALPSAGSSLTRK